jgi:hypothetical protein
MLRNIIGSEKKQYSLNQLILHLKVIHKKVAFFLTPSLTSASIGDGGSVYANTTE